MSEHGLEMSLRCARASPCFTWRRLARQPAAPCLQDWPVQNTGWAEWALALMYTSHRSWLAQNPARFTAGAIPFLPPALSTILPAKVCQLKHQTADVPPATSPLKIQTHGV